MRRVVVDSGAFIALLRPRERSHARVADHFRRLRREGARLVTTEPVIAESATRLRYDSGLAAASEFRRFLDEAVALRQLVVRESDPELRAAAFEVMAQFADLSLSYTDCMSAAVARAVRADAIFTLDDDFRALAFAVEP